MPGLYFFAIPLAGLIGVLAGWVIARFRGSRQESVPATDGSPSISSVNADELTALRREKAEFQIQLRQTERQLHTAQQELSSLLYSISHDLRAPLRSIDGFSQALIEDYGTVLDGTAHDYLRRVRASSSCMVELIEDVLKLSRISRVDLHPELLDVSAMVASLVEALQAAHPHRRVDCEIAPGVSARADRTLLEIALTHLLENAWKFTAGKAKGRIRFSAIATEPGGAVIYEVSDNGAGFDMQFAGKLFGAFQKMHSPSEYPGKGIGLTTVQRIVHRHGGRAWAKAVAGEGATFYFTLEPGEADLSGTTAEQVTPWPAPPPLKPALAGSHIL